MWGPDKKGGTVLIFMIMPSPLIIQITFVHVNVTNISVCLLICADELKYLYYHPHKTTHYRYASPGFDGWDEIINK